MKCLSFREVIDKIEIEMLNLKGELVVFLVLLIGVNCADFENSTEHGSETKQIAVGDLCSLKCGDDPYSYCDGDQDTYSAIKCVCPIKTQVYDAFRSTCISRCESKCGRDSNTVCSGDQTSEERTICGCKDSINWAHDTSWSRKCIKCDCKNGEKCTFDDQHLRIECKQCREGYTAVNRMCKGDCSNFPCKNGGSCRIKAENITCDCSYPFYGEFCEKSVHCDPNPCKNGGTCRGAGDTFECVCPDIYGGRNCSENIFCEKYGHEYCGNASCYVSKNPTKVQCTCGYRQVFDKISRTCIDDQCHPNPCKNGGTCFPGARHYFGQDPYKCLCRGNYKGTNCTEKEKTGCDNYVCGDGATCQYDEFSGGMSCICPMNEVYDDVLMTCTGNCKPNPCVHGTCRDYGFNFICSCDASYTGKYCDEKVNFPDMCKPDPCVHGICFKDGNYDYHCSCFGSYWGKNCNKAVTVNLTSVAVVVPLVVLAGIGLITALLIRKRNQKLRMRAQHSGMYQTNQLAMPVTVRSN